MDGELVAKLAAIFGFDATLTPTFIGIGVVIAAWCKERLQVTGRGVDVVVLVCMALMNGTVYWMNWAPAISHTIICTIGATGSWSAAKQLAKKIGK